jgi:hypothetical protein
MKLKSQARMVVLRLKPDTITCKTHNTTHSSTAQQYSTAAQTQQHNNKHNTHSGTNSSKQYKRSSTGTRISQAQYYNKQCSKPA